MTRPSPFPRSPRHRRAGQPTDVIAYDVSYGVLQRVRMARHDEHPGKRGTRRVFAVGRVARPISNVTPVVLDGR